MATSKTFCNAPSTDASPAYFSMLSNFRCSSISHLLLHLESKPQVIRLVTGFDCQHRPHNNSEHFFFRNRRYEIHNGLVLRHKRLNSRLRLQMSRIYRHTINALTRVYVSECPVWPDTQTPRLAFCDTAYALSTYCFFNHYCNSYLCLLLLSLFMSFLLCGFSILYLKHLSFWGFFPVFFFFLNNRNK